MTVGVNEGNSVCFVGVDGMFIFFSIKEIHVIIIDLTPYLKNHSPSTRAFQKIVCCLIIYNLTV